MFDDNLPDVVSPPLAPALDDDQIIALQFMQNSSHYIAEWRHVMQDEMVRMVMSNGKKHTIRRVQLEELQFAGLISRGHGGSFCLTDKGREWVHV